ncbi:FadR/GntR family transcriptional regulator [Streptomyces buecherae]|uniref:FadR family transcriptional regulator n=1 Tax=Streptomyces buecherae TaxID=2763006 RepID=A0A7H8N6L8_9ACTN|nr:FadR/GntR family transcriptional regulator [Streptomyces buecherae]MBC3993906.1 FadR family transcriptional regulator [Streptomyces buecherae]QKW50075.1 FadR family transcriptional regulator [Streptomyces buecherae]
MAKSEVAVHSRKVASDIQERIKRLIIDGRLPSGAPLPTEAELMELLGVSRNSVREALKALQAMGIVEIRHGFGTYVGAMSMAPMIEGLTFRTVAGHYRGEDSLLQLLELREALETGLLTRLVGRVPDADLATLDALVERMAAEAERGPVRAETDRAFHAALYRGLDNQLLSEVLEAFWDAFHRVRTDLVDGTPDPQVTCEQHREILAAVRSGDTLRAEAAIRDHFGNIRTRLRSAARPAPD